jgi:hypothetical protein
MSGIIGGAGSKSGVIGTTELDYEEGTLDPATFFLVGGSAVNISSGHQHDASYTKVGDICTVSYLVNTGSVNLGTGTITVALPFAVNSKYWVKCVGITYEAGGAGWTYNSSAVAGNNAVILEVYKNETNTVLPAGSTGQRSLYFGITYKTV